MLKARFSDVGRSKASWEADFFGDLRSELDRQHVLDEMAESVYHQGVLMSSAIFVTFDFTTLTGQVHAGYRPVGTITAEVVDVA